MYQGGGGRLPSVSSQSTEVFSRAAISTSAQATDDFLVDGYTHVHFAVRLFTSGTPSISSLVVEAEWTNEESPVSTDWAKVKREEFNTPGSGVASLTVYKPTEDSPAVPGSYGYTFLARGKYMRLKVYSGAAPTDVDFDVTARGT